MRYFLCHDGLEAAMDLKLPGSYTSWQKPMPNLVSHGSRLVIVEERHNPHLIKKQISMREVLPFETVPISAQPFRNQRLRRILFRTMTSPRNTTTENGTNRRRYMKYQHIAKMRVRLDFESNMLSGHKIASMSLVL